MTPKILIASFTDISKDPRALKQVRAAVEIGAVTTCSFGPSPHPDVEHLMLDPNITYPSGRIRDFLQERLRRAEYFPWVYHQIPWVRQARKLLRGRKFDAVIANNGDAARLVTGRVRDSALHIDLHEFFPGLVFDDGSIEAHRQQAYLNWLHDSAVAGTLSTSVVAPGIAREYQSFGIDADVVTNAGLSQDLPVRPTGTPIRYVHSGNSQSGRGLRRTMRAIAAAEREVTLDLYLVPNDLLVHDEIVRLAEELGDRIRIQPPVPQSELVTTLNQYDVGIFTAPASIPNTAMALPNKFFDFVQARLGVMVSPLPEMAHLVEQHKLGRITDGFETEDITRAINEFSAKDVDAAKRASDAIATELSGDAHHDYWKSTLRQLLSKQK